MTSGAERYERKLAAIFYADVAARLESLADPGGICISESARTAVGRKLPFAYEFMGEQQVKNIAAPVRTYRVLLEGAERRVQPDERMAKRPSIAVLPFENLSGDPGQEHLVDGAVGKYVWAERYDREYEDVFALQDELSETIVGALEPELGKVERERARAKRPENLDAWDLYQRDPNMGSFLVRMADAHLFMGQYAEAVEWARRALHQPHFQWSRYSALLSALGHLGRLVEAKSVLEQLHLYRPDFSIDFVQSTHLFTDAEDMHHYLEGLRKAGVT